MRLIRKGCVQAEFFGGKVASVEAGTPIRVARFYADSPEGSKGIVHGWRYTYKGVRIVVDYGLNAGGQRMLKPYPANVLSP
jgi:hypothetical protein